MNIDIEDANGARRRRYETCSPTSSPIWRDWTRATMGRCPLPKGLAADWPIEGVILFRVDGKPAGFTRVRRLHREPTTRAMGEFFVLRKCRRSGVGRFAAQALFDRFAGRWEMRELLDDAPAQAFWHRIIGDYTNGDFEDNREFFPACGREFVLQRVRSRRASRTPLTLRCLCGLCCESRSNRARA